MARTRRQERFAQRYGPWAVVTGASDGIGREFALALARAGLGVVLVARREDKLQALAQALRSEHGVQAQVVQADLARPAGVAALVAATRGLEVGLLVASAGFGTAGNFLDGPLAPELEMIDVNCRAVAELAHHYGGRFAQQRRGGLVLMSSLLGFNGVPRAANYAATKAYVQSLAEGLRLELRPLGVDVVACAPGPVASGFAGRAGMVMNGAAPASVVAQETLDGLGRWGTVRPGWLSKLLAWSLFTLPRWGKVRMLGVVMGGMTKHRG